MPKVCITLILFVLVLVTACGPDYNTDFDPPPPNARLDDVFPKEINGIQNSIERMNLDRPLEGFTALYGSGEISIDAILADSKTNADSHFKEVIAPRFDKMKNHFRGNINGRWRASGTDENGRNWFAWANGKWIFLISGSDKENLSNAIDAFKYVSK
jgi:hypothetical protein